jgi:group I intron endonuclease
MKNTIILFNENLPNQPAIIYKNAEIDRSQILSDTKSLAGIYMWTHIESNKKYIGSAVDLSKRLKDYYSPLYLKRADNYISKALLHYTYSAFSLTIIEFISIKDLSLEGTRQLILEREQANINLFLPEYNILKIAGSLLGYKHTIELIEKFSIAKQSKNHPMFGKSHSLDAITKISQALSGENNSMSKSVFVYSFNLEIKDFILYKSFNTCIDAAKYFNCSTRSISRYLDKNKIYKKQWILFSSEL